MPEQVPTRRAPRYVFGGAVEVTDLESGRMIIALARALSLYGCFIETDQSFGIGTKVMLKVTHSGSHFSTMAWVVDQKSTGIGVEFTDIEPIDRSRLEDCLVELAGRS
jgi:Tfp pilus assembly protein PilZ